MKRSLENQKIDLATVTNADVALDLLENRHRQLDPNVIDQLVQRIVEIVDPIKIILFGSAARNEIGPDSDIDVLVVMPEGVHKRKTAQLLYRDIRGLGTPFDILVTTPNNLEKQKDNMGLIYQTILREGKEVYAR